MNYGILVAEADEHYQLVAAVDSKDEAIEMAENYLKFAAKDDNLCPQRFVVHRRGFNGWYTVRETLPVIEGHAVAVFDGAGRRLRAEVFPVTRKDGRVVNVVIPEKE
jgi:hypothetical protein